MPNIYLSPSTQEWNPYVIGGTEEYYMNLLADALEPYLRANAIHFTRNTPDMTAASSIRQSNQGNYDLHLALHSNAAPENRAGMVRGSEMYYYPSSVNGQRLATLLADEFREIYPIPDRVRIMPTTSIGEVRLTKAPSVLMEVAYHDNTEDANWIVNNITTMAESIGKALAEYFGTPFASPVAPWTGTVITTGGPLNIRSAPSLSGEVVNQASNGDQLTVVGQIGEWYTVEYGPTMGFASANYIR
ncbi:N-acetylmuramoyl-L-alanine amidase [Christensenellaceae bacterium OttesenSCG-928-M15]|nr:N-acetylmuramoyl-L-alanine amidase [Christensenellaceae bacterium OttesenSCG-928-M15]